MARSRAKKAKKNLDHFSIYACHPCAGAMLIFSEGTFSNVSSLYINALSLLFLCDVGLVDGSLVKFGALWACGLVGFLWIH